MRFTSQNTKLLGIMGTPVEHTLSPKMHSYLAEQTGCDTVYLAFDVQPEHLGDAVASMKQVGALGFNITAPHKIAVMDYIDYIDPDAERMGTVNTIVNRSGAWHGYNTDGDGFVNSLEFEGTPLTGKDVLLLGAGGSARSVAYKFAKKGVGSVTISGRTPEKTRAILDVLQKHTNAAVSDDINSKAGYDIIVNTTPLGMHPLEHKNPFDRWELLKPGATACDLIYNPRQTLFLQEAEKRGAKIVNGLSMLVLQGIYAYEHFIGRQLEQMPLYHKLMALFEEFHVNIR